MFDLICPWLFSRRFLAEILAETLVVHGGADCLVRREDAHAPACGIAGARLEVIQGAGHLINVEAPEAFLGATRASRRRRVTTARRGDARCPGGARPARSRTETLR
jgi:pimeloyl-ACP methyl ester carboxylesterase